MSDTEIRLRLAAALGRHEREHAAQWVGWNPRVLTAAGVPQEVPAVYVRLVSRSGR